MYDYHSRLFRLLTELYRTVAISKPPSCSPRGAQPSTTYVCTISANDGGHVRLDSRAVIDCAYATSLSISLLPLGTRKSLNGHS